MEPYTCSDRLATLRTVRPTSKADPVRICLAVVLVLVACGGQAAETLPNRPAVPAGWIEVTEDRGEVRLFLPPDIQPFMTDGTVFANTPPGPTDTIWWEVQATGPWSLLSQPRPGQSLSDWLEQELHDMPARGPTTTEAVSLPAGRALRLRTSADTDTPNPIVVVAYAIPTSAGVGLLRIIGPAPQFEDRAEQLELVAMLLRFSIPHRRSLRRSGTLLTAARGTRPWNGIDVRRVGTLYATLAGGESHGLIEAGALPLVSESPRGGEGAQ
jgi:hypothetical protein